MTDALSAMFRAAGLPVPVLEYRFHPQRRWRWDWAWVDFRVALERQGGLWVRGRHSRARGQEADYEKFVQGQLLGWLVILASPEQLASGEALDWITEALILRGWQGEG